MNNLTKEVFEKKFGNFISIIEKIANENNFTLTVGKSRKFAKILIIRKMGFAIGWPLSDSFLKSFNEISDEWVESRAKCLARFLFKYHKKSFEKHKSK